MTLFVFGNFFWFMWSWSNQTHFASENIEKLGKFIEPRFSDEPANFRDAWIIFHFEKRPLPSFIELGKFWPEISILLIFHFTAIFNHRTKFIYLQLLATRNSLQSGINWTSTIEFDNQGHQQKKWKKKNKP